jgi:hypothetical protein
MSNKLLVAGVAIAAAASSAHAVETHPFVEPVVTGDVAFLATFSDGLGSWSGSKNDKYNGACARSERESEANGFVATTRTPRGADRVSVPSRARHRGERASHIPPRSAGKHPTFSFGLPSGFRARFPTIRFLLFPLAFGTTTADAADTVDGTTDLPLARSSHAQVSPS